MKIKQILFIFFWLFVFSVPTAQAQESFDIRRFETDITVPQAGPLSVTETITTLFTDSKHGIFRDVQAISIGVNVKEVTDEKGNPLTYKLIDFPDGIRIQIGDPDRLISGKQVYRIRYEVTNALAYFQEYDKLIWNATGNAWPVIIHEAVTRLKLPNSLMNEAVEFDCYTGESGSTAHNCAIESSSDNLQTVFTLIAPLPAYSGMTISASFPHGLLTAPSILNVSGSPKGALITSDEGMFCESPCSLELAPGDYLIQASKFGFSNLPAETIQLEEGKGLNWSFTLQELLWHRLLIILLFMLAAAIVTEPLITLYYKGRDPAGRGSIMPMYEPPKDLNPAEVGALVDETVHLRDIISTIVDLAVRGYLVINVLPKARGLLFKKDDYELIKQVEPTTPKRPLTSFERLFIEKLFSGNEKVVISALENKFYQHLPELKKAIYKSLADKKYFPKLPTSVRAFSIMKGIFVLILAQFLTIMELARYGTAYSSVLYVNGVLSIIVSYWMPRKTKEGVLVREHILGFKQYLKIAEKGRLEFQEKEELFYEFLPFAMALNVVDKWSEAFKGVFNQPPDWYRGAALASFNPSAFTSNIQGMADSMSHSFASHPSSSGSGGGGFSGGGGGGGGGGSW